MNREFLITLLQKVQNAKRIYRNEAALKIIENPSLFPYLVNETFLVNDILSVRAAWILEWICTHYEINLLLPHLNTFSENLHKLHFNGSIRSCAKVCEHIATVYISKKPYSIQLVLTKINIETIVEVAFDWLITPQKVAVKAYSMSTLYYFGLEIKWIHKALEEIITKDVIHQSKACEARGKKILALIHKKSNN